MRSHVEIVEVEDLIAHDARLPGGVGDVSERRLSTDEETGGATVVLDFDTAWRRPAGYTEGDLEWFVLDGAVRVGDAELAAGGYWRAPGGLSVPELEATAGTRVVQFRDGGYAFTPSFRDRTAFTATSVTRKSGWPGVLTIVGAGEPAWETDAASAACERHAGLRRRLLYQEPGPDWEPLSGPSTLLLEYPAGWRDADYEHEPAVTELFVLAGSADYNFGRLRPGGYAYRPPLVKHGDYTVDAEGPLVVLLRRGAAPVHWTTRDPWFRVDAEPLTYDPDDPAQNPGVVGLPLRSASTGRFSSTIR